MCQQQRTQIYEVGYLRLLPLTCWECPMSPTKQVFAQFSPDLNISGKIFNKGGKISCDFQKNLCRNLVCLNLSLTESISSKLRTIYLILNLALFRFRWRQILSHSNSYVSLLITYFTYLRSLRKTLSCSLHGVTNN